MNRQYKFRAKTLNNGIWVYGHYTQGTENNHYITNPEGSVWEVDSKTICRFTGLKDVNGDEIYEDDFVKTTHGILIVKVGAFFEVINGLSTGNNGNGIHAHDTYERMVIPIGVGFNQDPTIEKSGDIYDFMHLLESEDTSTQPS